MMGQGREKLKFKKLEIYHKNCWFNIVKQFKFSISLMFFIIFQRIPIKTIKMKALLLFACLILVSQQAINTGSCSKFSLDGQKCQECINHYHLYEGVCYVDILGCSQYIFGNICHQCENEYILVNNLCCDHNCLMKLLRRHQSKSLSATFTNNFQILSKIIPFVEQHFIKESLSNLVDIQQRVYIDVVRFAILYEFPSGRFKMRRAIIDYVNQTLEIVAVDWSIVQNITEFMEFHKDEINLKDSNKVNKILEGAFSTNPHNITHLSKAKLSQIDQYEIIYQDNQKQKIIFQTFYMRNDKKLKLLNEEKPVPQFMPYEETVLAKDFPSYALNHTQFQQVVDFVQNSDRYRPSFHHVLIKYKTRNVNEYTFYIVTETEEISFFIIYNIKEGSIKTIDFLKNNKEQLKPLIENVVSNINNASKTQLTHEENKVTELVQNAINKVKQEKAEQQILSEEKYCKEKDNSTPPTESEQIAVLNLFRERNPNILSFEIAQAWIRRYKTFNEWTFLIKIESGKTYTFYFFYVIQIIENNKLSFWGQVEVKEPKINDKGKYILRNPQENVPESQVAIARKLINEKYPQVVGFPLRKSIIREFPDQYRRFLIILRLEASQVRYIVLQENGSLWIQQVLIIKQNLDKITPSIESITKIQQKLQVIIDEVNHGKPIDPEVNLTKVDPIIIKQNKEQQKPKGTYQNQTIDKQVDLHNVSKSIEITPTPSQPSEPTIVNLESQTIKSTTTTEQGKKTQSIRTITPKDQTIITKIIKFITNTKYLTQTYVRIIQYTVPVTIIETEFCNHADYMLIFEVEGTGYVFGFRSLISNSDNVEYLGVYTFNVTAQMSDKDIIAKATQIRTKFDQPKALQAINNLHNQTVNSSQIQSVTITQVGDYLRVSVIIPNNNFINRYILSSGASENESYSIIQQCRLQPINPIYTQTKVTATGQTQIITNEVEKLIENDNTTKSVIENIQNNIPETSQSSPANIKITDYDKKTEFVVIFEKNVTQNSTGKVLHEVVIIHDKVSHDNDILSSQPINNTELVVSPQEPKIQQSVSEPQQPKINNQTQPEQPALPEQTQITTPSTNDTVPVSTPQIPQVPEQKYTLVEGITPEAPVSIHQVINLIIQEVKEKQGLSNKEVEIGQSLIKDNVATTKIEQVINVPDKQEKLLVTAIVAKDTNKYVIEDIKIIDNHTLNHLTPVSTPQELVQQPTQEPSSQNSSQHLVESVKISLQEVQNELKQKQQEQKCDEIKSYIEQKQAQQSIVTQPVSNTSTPKNKTQPQVIVINPSDIQTIVDQIKDQIAPTPAVPPTQAYTPQITFNKDEALAYLETIKPETADTKVLSSIEQNYPTSVSIQFVLQNNQNRYHVVLNKNSAGIDLVSYDQSPLLTSPNNPNTTEAPLQTISTIVKQFESVDKAGYVPVDTNSLNMIKATQIINNFNTTNTTKSSSQQNVDLSNPSNVDSTVVEQLRNEYPVIKDAPVIQITNNQVSPDVKQTTVNFYVKDPETNNYTVQQIVTQVNTSNEALKVAPISVTEVINNGQQTNVVLEENNPTEATFANAAFGYTKVDLSTISKNPDIQAIQMQIQSKYSNFIQGDSIQSIQILQLKNGKVNFIFRYKHIYFTVYWDSVLKKIVFLNEVNTLSQIKFDPITQNQYYTIGMQAIAALHPTEMQTYKVLSSGQHDEGDNYAFTVEFSSSGKKYREIFRINKSTLETTEVTFIELVEISLSSLSLVTLTATYHVLDSHQYSTNQYFPMVDRYNKNHNQVLKDAKILAVGYKPQNLGFTFKVDYFTSDGNIYEVETYIETFSQKYTQSSFTVLDLLSGFSPISPNGVQVDNLLNAIAIKASVSLASGNYSIQSLQGKNFFYGILFNIDIIIEGVEYTGLVYLDSTNANLLTWNVKPRGDGCQTKSVDLTKCIKCASGFTLSSDNTSCIVAIAGCDTYGLDKSSCSVCQAGNTKMLGICTTDCGPLCTAVAFP